MAPDGSNINPVALNFLNAKNRDGTFVIPSPQTSASGVNYTAVVPGSYNEDQFNTNFDVNLRTADQPVGEILFLRLESGRSFLRRQRAWFPGAPRLSEPEFGNRRDSHFLAASDQPIPLWLLSSCGSKRCRRDAHRSGCGDKAASAIPRRGIIPQTEILGAFQFGNSAQDQSNTAGNNFYISDVIFLSRGKHNLRLGTEIFRNQFNHLSDYTAGTMTLLSFPDFLLGLPAGPASAGGNGTSFSNVFFTSVAAGIPDAGQRASAERFFCGG